MTKVESLKRLELEVGVLVRRVRRVLCERAQEVHPDLQSSGYTILVTLAGAGERRSSEISEEFGVDKGAVSRQVQHLLDLGLVERAPDPADGRASLIRISAFGAGRLAEVSRARRRSIDDRLSDWPEAELAQFVAALARYNTTLD